MLELHGIGDYANALALKFNASQGQYIASIPQGCV